MHVSDMHDLSSDGVPTSPQELRELRAVSEMLRSLPDPEPPAELLDRVMTEVAAREARPRLVRAAFRRATSPAVATALAAGLATLAVLTAIQQESKAPEAPLVPMAAHRVADANPTPAPHTIASPASVIPAGFAQPVRLFARGATPNALGDLDTSVVQAANVLDQRLDYQINRLLLDPLSFYRQVEEAKDSDALIQRIADRAGKRGDAAEIALQLRKRAPGHDVTDHFIERLLHAALIEYIANR